MAPLQSVVEAVKQHAGVEFGVSNQLLEQMATRLCSSDFKGVYSADYLPPKLAALARGILIVNLGTRRGVRTSLPVGHFITIILLPSTVLYLDSYGLPCKQPHVQTFLRLCRRDIQYNEKKIQDLSSNYCGFYALLFACYFDRMNWGKISKDFKLHFSDKNLKQNDKLCDEYLKIIAYKLYSMIFIIRRFNQLAHLVRI